MAETWEQQYRRECREMADALDAALAEKDDVALRAALEALAPQRPFGGFSWRWGPLLAKRNRVVFRPFCLAHLSSWNVDATGKAVQAWKPGFESAKALERWLRELDERDDLELTRRLYHWRLSEVPWKERQGVWGKDLVRAFREAQTPAARQSALAKRDSADLSLDPETAKQLYELDAAAARAFLLSRVPRYFWAAEKRSAWAPLLALTQTGDQDLHFALYRKLVDEKPWQDDVRGLLRSVPAGGDLDGELSRRHPESALGNTAEVFLEVVQSRKTEALPYVLRNVGAIRSSWSWAFGRAKNPKALVALIALADQRGYLDLWGALLRTAATRELFDAEVARLVQHPTLPDTEVADRLRRAAGLGREYNFAGGSAAEVKYLDEKTARALYERFPELLRGPYRVHVAPGSHGAYPSVVRRALEVGREDEELSTFFGARLALLHPRWGDTKSIGKSIDNLCEALEAMPEATFVERAAAILSRIPAFAIYGYTELLRHNRLARLLFERATTLYLQSSPAMRDLLEAPQIHVQLLALRALASGDERASAIAAEHVDLLQATLFRPLHRRTRLIAFRAIEAASDHDEQTARYLVRRIREAMALPSKRYPKEALVETLGTILARWPALQSAAERPRVFASSRSEALP
jgi:hypothetical protein